MAENQYMAWRDKPLSGSTLAGCQIWDNARFQIRRTFYFPVNDISVVIPMEDIADYGINLPSVAQIFQHCF